MAALDERAVRAVLATLPDVFYVIDTSGNVVQWNDRLTAVTKYDDEEIEEMEPLDFVPEADREMIAAAIESVLSGDHTETRQSALVTKDGEHIPYEFNARRITNEDGEVAGFVGTGRNITERRERERELRQQRDELETLNRINELVREVIRELVAAASREEIEETVCSYLADSDLYRFAWVSEYDIVENSLVTRAKAGDDDGYQELIGELAGGDWERPATTVLETGEHLVVRDISETPLLPERLRVEASHRGLHSGIAVPLSYGQTTYGVLVVYATRPDAFTEREAAGFDVLGELVGFAINAAESKKLLTTDAVVELEFHVTDDDAVMVDLSRRTDCRLVLDGTVPTSDGRYLYYVRVEGTPPEQVAESAVTLSTVYDARVISTHSDGGLLLLTVSSSLAELFVDAGAKVLTARAQDGVEQVIVETAQDTDIRTLIGSVRSSYRDIELVAKREVERTDETVTEFRDVLATDLTNRQLAAFRAAYLAGYYDWPRDSTAEEVAETMGIAPATLHQHLRKAEGKLAAAFFDDVSS